MTTEILDFLRNDYTAEIILAGVAYPTVEHAYQAAKTDDTSVRHKIAKEPSVQKARKIGRSAPLVSDWKKKRLGVMEALVRQKFFSHDDLQDKLVDTGHVPIHMVRDDDHFWGIDDNEKGENNLGKILEKVRAEAQFIQGWTEKEPLTDDEDIQLVLDEVEGLVGLLPKTNTVDEEELFNLMNVPQQGVIGIIDKRRLAKAILNLEAAWLDLVNRGKDDQEGSDS
jgi:ribA/ribD-fused uncharacterized protein